jgi:hypothetical protein
MGVSRWTDEVEAEHLAAFGPALGPVYSALSSEVLWLHTKWLDFRQLYAGSAKRIELLNETAPDLFFMLQQVLWRDVLLHIARLTDPATTGKRENLSLLSLPPLLECSLNVEVSPLLARTLQKAAFARAYRNKNLAHQDMDHALGRAEPLNPGCRKDVEDVLACFASVLNAIDSYYCCTTMLYGEPAYLGDADALIYWLNFGLLMEAKRRKRVEAGSFSPDDLEHPKAP